jgi:hypothetical protein
MQGEVIRGVHVIDAQEDSAAIMSAAALLNASPEHQGIEIWRGARLVARIPQPESSG